MVVQMKFYMNWTFTIASLYLFVVLSVFAPTNLNHVCLRSFKLKINSLAYAMWMMFVLLFWNYLYD